jgi:hypothetical protein
MAKKIKHTPVSVEMYMWLKENGYLLSPEMVYVGSIEN